MMGFGLLLMIVFWVGLIAVGFWLVRALFPHANQAHAATGQELSAREILDRRFARGEINSEEYDIMKRDIADGTR